MKRQTGKNRRMVIGLASAGILSLVGCLDRSAEGNETCERRPYLVVDRTESAPKDEVLSADDERIVNVDAVQRGLEKAANTTDDATTVDLSSEECTTFRDGLTDDSDPLYVKFDGEVYHLRLEGDDSQ